MLGGLNKLHAWSRACMQRACNEFFTCMELRGRKSIKTSFTSTPMLFKVVSCFLCLKANNIWNNKICHS